MIRGKKSLEYLENFILHVFLFQCMSMIEDMTKEKQALSDEHQKQMDQTKGVSTHVPE
jgi:F0F1-type ATP synthase delta subunit